MSVGTVSTTGTQGTAALMAGLSAGSATALTSAEREGLEQARADCKAAQRKVEELEGLVLAERGARARADANVKEAEASLAPMKADLEAAQKSMQEHRDVHK